MGGSGDAAKKTQEQIAMERRQRMQLDEETASSERRLKAVAQKNLGKQSLLKNAVKPVEAPAGPTITPGARRVDQYGGTRIDSGGVSMMRKAFASISGIPRKEFAKPKSKPLIKGNS